MTTLLWIVLATIGAYALFVATRLGLHRRLPLALGPISIDKIPDRAAAAHRNRALFTCDTPVSWRVPALRYRGHEGRSWSAADVRVATASVAKALRDQAGVGRGDRVAILKANHFDMHLLTASVVRAGAIACPINGKFPAEKLFPYLSNIGAKVLITDTATLARILIGGGRVDCVETVLMAEPDEKAVPGIVRERLAAGGVRVLGIEAAMRASPGELPAVPRGADEPLYLVHSSGTTGFPKAVILENGAQSHAIRGWLCYVHVSPARDRGFLAVPNNHQAVILTFNSMLLLGLRGHWTSAYDRDELDPHGVVTELARGAFTGFFGFPIAYTMMKEVELSKHDLSRMRFWASTADASHAAVQRPFVAVGNTFRSLGIPRPGSVYLDAQGSSEVGTPSVIRYVTAFTKKFDRRIGKPGSTPFGPRTRIMRLDGTTARDGEAGRLMVKGRTVFAGYWNNHPLTLAAFRDGWFFTGDVAARGTDGHFLQLDREVDVIHSARGPVYSLPIEEVVHEHPAVFDACVYGARQPDGTQAPVAAIALRDGVEISAEALIAELNAALSAQNRLTEIRIMPWSEFPIGVTGKTLKRVFRERTEPVPPAEANRPVAFATSEVTEFPSQFFEEDTAFSYVFEAQTVA